MAADQAQDALAVEFDTFMARAGITIPEGRRAAILPPMSTCARR